MLHTLKLLLPALIPSWRFFDAISPSPRIEFALLQRSDDLAKDWQEFRPRPVHLSIGGMIKRLFWNPQWNETLFLVSCAERLIENPTDHSYQEILKRIRADIKSAPYLQYRLVFVRRDGVTLQKETLFISSVHAT